MSADRNSDSEEGPDPALLAAVKAEDTEAVRRLIYGQGAICIRVSDEHLRRAIHHAAMRGNVPIIRLLVRAGSPVNLLDGEGRTPLHMAVEAGHRGAVEALVELGAHINSCGVAPGGETTMHVAARCGHASLLAFLIRRGGNVNVLLGQGDQRAQTPLHCAASNGQFRVVEVLCHAGADPDARDATLRRTPLHYAAERGSVDTVRSLLRHGACLDSLDAMTYTPLMLAVKDKKVEVVQLLLERGARVAGFNTSGLGVLQLAVIIRSKQCLRSLLASGMCVDEQSLTSGESPLMLSLALGEVDIAKLLLEYGANVNLCDNKFYTPLHRCPILPIPEATRCELLEMLLMAKADLERRDHEGHTPLQRCLYSDTLRHEWGHGCVKLLVEAGCRLGPDLFTHSRHSPLLYLCFSGWLQKAAYLINTGWDLTFETWIMLPGSTDAQTAMHKALVRHASSPRPLRGLCRLAVRQVLLQRSGHTEILSWIQRLPVPAMVRNYLLFRDRDYAEWAPDLLCPDFPMPLDRERRPRSEL